MALWCDVGGGAIERQGGRRNRRSPATAGREMAIVGFNPPAAALRQDRIDAQAGPFFRIGVIGRGRRQADDGYRPRRTGQDFMGMAMRMPVQDDFRAMPAEDIPQRSGVAQTFARGHLPPHNGMMNEHDPKQVLPAGLRQDGGQTPALVFSQ